MLTLADPVRLTAELVDMPSVSGDEKQIADVIERILAETDAYEVLRDGDAVVVRTPELRGRRLVLAGHLDTVPLAGNLPHRRKEGRLYGCGASDMKSGVAVMLHLAHHYARTNCTWDLSFVFYDHEEASAEMSGFSRLVKNRPQWLMGDLAILLEPTSGRVELGCQGTLRAIVRTKGKRAHAARPGMGVNAIHAAIEPLARLANLEAREVTIDGCVYREAMSATQISGGVAMNVIPDVCEIGVNYRFAPDRTEEDAAAYVRKVFADLDVEVEIGRSAPSALPRGNNPDVASFSNLVGGKPEGKYGWTDVARFAQLGIPALNYGPGDPGQAHTAGEYVDIEAIGRAVGTLREFVG